MFCSWYNDTKQCIFHKALHEIVKYNTHNLNLPAVNDIVIMARLTDSKPWWTWKNCILNGDGDAKNCAKRKIREKWNYDDHDKVHKVTTA